MLSHLPTSRSARTAIGVVLGLSLLTLSACGSGTTSHDQAPDGGALLRSKVGQAPADDSTDLTAATAGLRGLGFDLARHLPADSGHGGNQVFSPASLAIAFAMLREGADRQAGREVDDVIGLPANRRAAYNRIVHALTDVGAGDTLEINDALFVDPGEPMRQSFLDAIKTWYGAGVQQTPFPDPALDVINSWVNNKTHGRIPRLLDQLDPMAVAALVNTIYLNAKWATPFDPTYTDKQAFSTGTGEQVSVQTMHQDTTLDYASDDDWQAVRLPYAGGKLSMWVLLPRDAADPRSLLAPDVLAQAAAHARPTDVNLSLPRWDTATSASLTDLLEKLGLTSVFAAGHLTGMSPDPSLYVGDVVQQANITVGEKGTEAAAATAIVYETSGMAMLGETFTADHPFAYAVVDDATGVPLFEGVVADPSQN